MKQYTVITGDIVSSRDINNFNRRLEKKLQKIDYPDSLFTPFRLSQGDEIQCVLRGSYFFTRFIRKIRYILSPFELYFGVGIGKIEEGLNRNNSWQMNGSALYRARTALEEVKEKGVYNTKLISNKKADQTINTIQYLIDTLQSDWTEAQWEAIHLYEKKGTYQKAAESLDIAYQNVQKRCKAAKWKRVKFAEDNLEEIFTEIFKSK